MILDPGFSILVKVSILVSRIEYLVAEYFTVRRFYCRTQMVESSTLCGQLP